MTEEIFFRLRIIEGLLRRAPEYAYSKAEILSALNEQLSCEGYATISDRTLDSGFRLLEEHGATIQRLSGSPVAMYALDLNPSILTEDAEFVYFGPYMQYMSGVSCSTGAAIHMFVSTKIVRLCFML